MRGRVGFCVSGALRRLGPKALVDCAGAAGKGNRLRAAESEAHGMRRLGAGQADLASV